MRKIIEIYTDGACSGNPGIGGYGAVLIYNGIQKQISGVNPETTNNRMELTAIIEALKLLKEKNLELHIFSDSAYIVNAFNNDWITNWILNDFKTSCKKPVMNQDLWFELLKLLDGHEFHFVKVKGHSDVELNNLCDGLATSEIAKYKKEHNLL